MKHKITVITNEQGKVVGAVRNEMKVQGQILSLMIIPLTQLLRLGDNNSCEPHRH